MGRIDRRSFLKAGGAGIAAAAVLGDPAFAVRKQAGTVESPELAADVVVVGAGASGIPAAIAAARQGVKVILLEEDMIVGGAPVDMYVSMLCGGPRVGIYHEMAEALNAGYDFSGKPVEGFNAGDKGGCNYWYVPAAFVEVLNSMIARETNIKLLCGATVVAAVVRDSIRNRVCGVRVQRAGGATQSIKAKITIDATGTGLIGELAGCKIMYGRDGRKAFAEPFGPDEADLQVQRCTWMYISQRLRPGAVLPFKKIHGGGMVEHRVNHWVGVKWEGKDDDYISRAAGIYLHWGANLHCEDTRDPVALAQTQQKALEIMRPDIAVLREAGFAVHLAPKLGVREVRRVCGDHVLTVTDLKSGKLPDDTIAITDGGIDLHQKPPLTQEQVIIPRAGIPYRSLIAKDTEGLLIAGKSFSCTSYALGACRVQPVVAAIGQAAGTAAALAAKDDTDLRSINIKSLQSRLPLAKGT